MQGKRIFAYVPVGKLPDEEGTIVRIGYTTSQKPLDKLYTGLNRPDVVLFEMWAERMLEPCEWCEELKSIMRGHVSFSRTEKFGRFENRSCLLGDKYFICPYSVEELTKKFEEMGNYFTDYS